MAKIGIEWVKKYHGRAPNLSNTQKQAEGFYNKLSGTRSFNWGDDLAWDQDFEEKGVGSPVTGTDTTWIDSVHIAFDACEILRRSGVFDRWRDTLKGLHIILGFHTTCGDESKRGRYFAEYLNDGYTVIEAWKKACKETESSGTKWAYLRSGGGSGVNTYNDHWHGKGWVSPDPTNSWRAYSKGSC